MAAPSRRAPSSAAPAVRTAGAAASVSVDELVVSWRRMIAVLLHDATVDQVILHDLLRAVDIHVRVPHVIRINDHHGAVAALVHAAGVIDADGPLEAGGLDALLEHGVNGVGALRWAGAAGGA